MASTALTTVDGRLVAELCGDYRTYAFAVGGKNDHHTFVLQKGKRAKAVGAS